MQILGRQLSDQDVQGCRQGDGVPDVAKTAKNGPDVHILNVTRSCVKF